MGDAAALTGSQKELRNRLGRKEWSGNSVEEDEEASSGMCVRELGGGVFCFDLVVLQNC